MVECKTTTFEFSGGGTYSQIPVLTKVDARGYLSILVVNSA